MPRSRNLNLSNNTESLAPSMSMGNSSDSKDMNDITMVNSSDYHNDLEKGIMIRNVHEKYAAFMEEVMRGYPTKSNEEMRPPSFLRQVVAEFIGTTFLVTLGIGVNASAVICGAQSGLFQIGMTWGIAAFLAICMTGSISGAHLNPAISFAFAILRPRDFPLWKLVPYWCAQLAGGIFAGCINYIAFSSAIEAFEVSNNITRGEPGSEWSAMVFGEYFPNPDIRQNNAFDWNPMTVTYGGSLGVEAFGTAILMFTVLSLNDPRNGMYIPPSAAAFGVGMVIAILITVYAPLNQTGFNPARDFGPRLVSYGFGWKEIALPGVKHGFWTYIVGPLIGAPIGGAIHDFVLMRSL